MTNKEENFTPYFKIKWMRRSRWTLEQAAYLTCGKNPDAGGYEIAATAENPVSRRYHWLDTKFQQGELHAREEGGVSYFNAGSMMRMLDERGIKVDDELNKVRDYMLQWPDGPNCKMVSRSVYRHAGKLIAQQYPMATKKQLAEALVDLPSYFNDDELGCIETLTAVQIGYYLKGLNELTGKVSQQDLPEVIVDFPQLLENM